MVGNSWRHRQRSVMPWGLNQIFASACRSVCTCAATLFSNSLWMCVSQGLCLCVQKKITIEQGQNKSKCDWLSSWGCVVQSGGCCCVQWTLIFAETICTDSFTQSLKYKSDDSGQTHCHICSLRSLLGRDKGGLTLGTASRHRWKTPRSRLFNANQMSERRQNHKALHLRSAISGSDLLWVLSGGELRDGQMILLWSLLSKICLDF